MEREIVPIPLEPFQVKERKGKQTENENRWYTKLWSIDWMWKFTIGKIKAETVLFLYVVPDHGEHVALKC